MRTRLISLAALVVAVSAISAAPSVAATVSDQDAMFVKSAHQGNLAEIAAGQDAQKHATTKCVKTVGAVLVRDHGKLDADLKMLADKLNVMLPASPTEEQKRELAAVQAKAGTSEYDAAWLKTQDAAHTKTLSMIDHELKAGKNAEVMAAARAARPVVAMHLDMVRGGTCHAGKDARMVRAGSGGHLAAADGALATAELVSMAGGGLLAAGGAAWFWRTRRRSAEHR
jgi:putative membrane protein